MSNGQNNEMRFVLFPNSRKEKEGQPDYTGEITINGQRLRLSGWRHTKAEKNLTYVSGSVSEFQENNQQAAAAVGTPGNFTPSAPATNFGGSAPSQYGNNPAQTQYGSGQVVTDEIPF